MSSNPHERCWLEGRKDTPFTVNTQLEPQNVKETDRLLHDLQGNLQILSGQVDRGKNSHLLAKYNRTNKHTISTLNLEHVFQFLCS